MLQLSLFLNYDDLKVRTDSALVHYGILNDHMGSHANDELSDHFNIFDCRFSH